MEDCRCPRACIGILPQLTQHQQRRQHHQRTARETNCSSWKNSSLRFQTSAGTTRMRLQETTTITKRRWSAAIAFLVIGSIASKSSNCIVSSFTTIIPDRWCSSAKTTRFNLFLQSAVVPLLPIDERLFLQDSSGGYSEHVDEAKSSEIGPVTTHLLEHEVSAIMNTKGGDNNSHRKVETIEATTTASESSSRMVLSEQRRRAVAAELLRNRQTRTNVRSVSSGRSSTSTTKRTTGERVLDAIRRSSLRSTFGINDDKQKTTTSASEEDNAKATVKKVTRSMIRSAIEEIMENHHSASRANDMSDENSSSSSSSSSMTSSLSSFVGNSIGVLGDQQDWKTLKDRTDMSKLTIVETNNNVLVRMASSLDDVDIANLRLSVFANCSLHERSQFCTRSCLAIAARRKRGASCLVATRSATTTTTTAGESPLVLGSVECSFHEFYGTQLGKRRKQHSILYVTEVAVSPSARRQGIGSSLLQAIDILAMKRSIETLYLHVDVSNDGAIQLYKKAGYSRVANAAMFQEFTRSLNLHPGATKGRDHFLFFKNLTPCPIWLDSVEMERQKRQRTDENKRLEVFGFEIPA